MQSFINYCNELGGSYKRIYAIEPDPESFKCLSEKYARKQNIICLNRGVSDKKGVLKFESFSGQLSMASQFSQEGSLEVQIDTIDNIVENHSASFIKMDIEGVELAALHGASETILHSLPKLAICVYHKNEDIFTILQYIKALVPEYKFYLRAHTLVCLELVLYAIPKIH